MVYKKLSVAIINQRLENLNKEEQTIESLIKEAQTKHLKEGSLSEEEYKTILSNYDLRVGKIRQIRSKLRNKRISILKTEKDLEGVEREEKEIKGLMKQLQEDYLRKGKISRTRFFRLYNSDKERLAEVEEERQLLKEKLDEEKINKKYKLLRYLNGTYIIFEDLVDRSFDYIKSKFKRKEKIKDKVKRKVEEKKKKKEEKKKREEKVLQQLVNEDLEGRTFRKPKSKAEKKRIQRIVKEDLKRTQQMSVVPRVRDIYGERYKLSQEPNVRNKREDVYKMLRENFDIDARES